MSILQLLMELKTNPESAARWQADPEALFEAHGITSETRAVWRARNVDLLDRLVLAEFHALLAGLGIARLAANLWPNTYEGTAQFNRLSPTTASVGAISFTVGLTLVNVQSAGYTVQPVDYKLISGTTVQASAGSPTLGFDASGKPNAATFSFSRTITTAGTYSVALVINDPGQEDDGLTVACGTVVVS
jgi:hypothetical protein